MTFSNMEQASIMAPSLKWGWHPWESLSLIQSHYISIFRDHWRMTEMLIGRALTPPDTAWTYHCFIQFKSIDREDSLVPSDWHGPLCLNAVLFGTWYWFIPIAVSFRKWKTSEHQTASLKCLTLSAHWFIWHKRSSCGHRSFALPYHEE